MSGAGSGGGVAVLFDMGGVLLDPGNPGGFPDGALDFRGREALLGLLREAGGRAEETDLAELLFDPWRSEWEQRTALGREARWKPHLDRLIAATGTRASGEDLLRAWFRPYGESLRPFPGAVEVPVTLAAMGFELAIVSNVPLPGRLYRERLDVLRVSQPFRDLRFSYDEGTRKPSPALLLRALDALGVPPERAVMVGDRRERDVAAGVAAGTRTIQIGRGRDERGPRPDATVPGLEAVPSTVEELLSSS